MKTLQEIKAELETLKPTLRERFGVETIGVFGSYTRENKPKKAT
jgi:predicted nucleotidyltransferase